MYPNLRRRIVGAGTTRGYEYRVTVPVTEYPAAPVRILFLLDVPTYPAVFAPPSTSPHRFEDGTLCMWYRKDGPDHTWLFRDGLVALLGYVALHLFRENWWEEYGEWLGPEVPHGRIAAEQERRTAA